MESYKGIKRGQSVEIFYWLDEHCHNTAEHVLENDIVLQAMVKRHHRKRFTKIMLLNLSIWTALIYGAYSITK